MYPYHCSVILLICSLQAHVFGIRDEKLGSMPAAVLSSFEGELESLKTRLTELVVSEQGDESRLAHIFTLEEIGLSSIPKNATGKVMRRKLVEAAERHLASLASKERLPGS